MVEVIHPGALSMPPTSDKDINRTVDNAIIVCRKKEHIPSALYQKTSLSVVLTHHDKAQPNNNSHDTTTTTATTTQKQQHP